MGGFRFIDRRRLNSTPLPTLEPGQDHSPVPALSQTSPLRVTTLKVRTKQPRAVAGSEPCGGRRKYNRCSSGDAAWRCRRHDFRDIFPIDWRGRLCHRRDSLAQGRSHPYVVGNLERTVRPPDPAADAHGVGGSAACRELRHTLCQHFYHVSAAGLSLARLARANPRQTQGPHPVGDTDRIDHRCGGYRHIRSRRSE